MLDPIACAGVEIGAAGVAPFALMDLHDLLVALGFRREARDDSNVVQEDRDEVCKTGANFARTPAHDGARLAGLRGMKAADREAAIRRLARLLIEAAGIAVTEGKCQ